MNIQDLEGVGPVLTAKFTGAGVKTTDALLKKGGSAKGRAKLSEATGMSTKRILGFVNRADLYRIKGVGSEYADLLETAGVDTVVELANRNAENLVKALKKANDVKKKVRSLPTAAEVGAWIKQAKSLPRAVEY